MEQVRDKTGILRRLPQLERVILDLGCGPVRRRADWIGVDRLDYESVDLVGEVCEALRLFPDGTVDEVHSSHFFEHVEDLPGLMREIQRALKKNGVLEIIVPHFSNPYFYSDHTHRTFFGLYSFSYLATDRLLKREVPNYQTGLEFELRTIKLIFRSPFRVRHVLKCGFGALVNSSSWAKEFYEENLCYLFPCYEIEYTLRRK
jgi:SAM-dependent methyltransferase